MKDTINVTGLKLSTCPDVVSTLSDVQLGAKFDEYLESS